MAVDFEALDFIRTRNKARQQEARNKQKREELERAIKPFMKPRGMIPSGVSY